MQVIQVIWPVLLCAFLTAVLLAWVLCVALPRMHHAEKRRRGPSARLRDPRKSLVIDEDQQTIRRNV